MTTTGLFQAVGSGDVTIVVFALALRRYDEVRQQDVSRQLLKIAGNAVSPWMSMYLAETQSFVEVLLRAWKRIGSREDARFAVGGLQKYCRRVLKITQVDRLMPLFATRDEAVAARSSPSDRSPQVCRFRKARTMSCSGRFEIWRVA